jgi:hypothetical protein
MIATSMANVSRENVVVRLGMGEKTAASAYALALMSHARVMESVMAPLENVCVQMAGKGVCVMCPLALIVAHGMPLQKLVHATRDFRELSVTKLVALSTTRLA